MTTTRAASRLSRITAVLYLVALGLVVGGLALAVGPGIGLAAAGILLWVDLMTWSIQRRVEP